MRVARRAELPSPSREWNERDGRLRVLVESPDPAMAWVSQSLLDEAGYAAEVCRGPGAMPGSRCPILEGRGCPLADGADVIVHMLPTSDWARYPVLTTLRRCRPKVPICVEVPAPKREERARELDGCIVVDLPVTGAELIDAVNDASGRTRGRR